LSENFVQVNFSGSYTRKRREVSDYHQRRQTVAFYTRVGR